MAVHENSRLTVEINSLSFPYPGIDGHPPPGSTPLIDEFSLTLHSGDSCLLVGSYGAGKTTLLKIIGGKHMVEQEMVEVLGRSAFHDTALTASEDLSYLGVEWRREVALLVLRFQFRWKFLQRKLYLGLQESIPKDEKN